MSIWVQDLVHYPIKSVAGNFVTQSTITRQGLWQDRRYMLVNDKGRFVTARKLPALSLLQVKCNALFESTNAIWEVTAPKDRRALEPLVINPNDFSQEYNEVSIWKSDLTAQACGKVYDQWFSKYLGQPVKLVWFSDRSIRQSPEQNTAPSAPVAFADAYPLLIISRASLDKLNQWSPEMVDMRQFRPNIIIDGCDAFEEETWQRFRIGNVLFESVIPCVRCIFTTINPDTAVANPQGEPLKTLTQQRLWIEKGKKKGPIFGMNVIATNSGECKTGDAIEVLTYRDKPTLLKE